MKASEISVGEGQENRAKEGTGASREGDSELARLEREERYGQESDEEADETSYDAGEKGDEPGVRGSKRK